MKREAVANRFEPKPALLFENGNLVAAVGVVKSRNRLLAASC